MTKRKGEGGRKGMRETFQFVGRVEVVYADEKGLPARHIERMIGLSE
jgi:hypothetical protein